MPNVNSENLEAPAPSEFQILPASAQSPLYFHDLWEYRDLLIILVWRDLKVRYKQTVIGVGWVLIQPLITMIVFSVMFGRFGKLPSAGVPYPALAYTALLPWQFFSRALTEASVSLVVNERVISKVYFPRLIVPTAVVLAGLVDFAVAASLLALILLYYSIPLTWAILTVPFFVLLAVLTALGAAYWLSALDVEYRDVRHTLFLAQLWLFLSPVAYSSQLVPPQWRTIYGLNPMVGVIEGLRWAILGQQPAPDPGMLLFSTLALVLLFLGGVAYFRRVERTMADLL